MSPDVPQDEPQSQHATTVDKHVGQRIRELRLAMGLSQQQLARLIGVTYQQAHKYERGLNRISAGRLFVIAQAFATDPAWFFEGISGRDEAQELTSRQRRQLALLRNFALIKDEKHQEAISSMARTLAGS
ncbi:helix-turn-helix domain-containing protein [Belnapia rosea]|uniref:Transcriptional regulator, contains XRE-family HTH domain n=1 Tax=Belnapia rosea TaxID=938405 RepID=A0A1G6Z381_9PROT|nr:helix-turn-helix transcriptional regulator [Belnapia rosea]SDD97119.1 Transcriptional regulator, contains XRE-family HTH domain [Belnapia rosea]